MYMCMHITSVLFRYCEMFHLPVLKGTSPYIVYKALIVNASIKNKVVCDLHVSTVKKCNYYCL